MNKSEVDSWVRLESKSRPGRFYLFNKSTGESQWQSIRQKDSKQQQNIEAPLKISINKSKKTPAQDRLKRLQNNLKTSQTKTYAPNKTRDRKAKVSKEENELLEKPSTSAAKPILTKCSSLPTQSANFTDIIQPLSLDKSGKKPITESVSDKCTTSKLEKPTNHTQSISKESTATTLLESSKNIETSSSKLRTGIFKKLKEICNIPLKKLGVKNEKPSSIISTTEFKAKRKIKTKQSLTTTVTQVPIVNQSKPENNKNVASNPELRIPSYPRGSANSRLERLKKSLVLQQDKSSSVSNSTNTLKTNSNFLLERNDKKVTSPQKEDIHPTTPNVVVKSQQNTANNTNGEEIEAMDWQPIENSEEINEKSNGAPPVIVEKSRKCCLKEIIPHENQTMGDIIDVVNKNLLRFSAEQQKDSINNNDNKKKWLKDFYYFIVDTNVFLRDLTFIEDLSKMKLCDTNGSILYIPYSVLQELDKLKMRSGAQEGVKTLAVRAIKYLNSKFESNSCNLQAQSALDERNHFIDINSADDSIINCCLQVKQNVPNLLLLTEDINLRNKAICNNILVAGKSNLMEKRYDKSDKS